MRVGPIVSFTTAVLTALFAIAIVGEEPAKKLPPPDAKAQAEAMKLIKEVYGSQVTAAKTPDQKKTLAEKIFQAAKENASDPSAQFILLRLTKDIAAQASDCQTALSAIDEIDKTFQIDAVEMKSEVLRKCASATTSADQHAALADKILEVADAAVAADNFTFAVPLVDLAFSEAKKAKDEALAKHLLARRAEVEGIAHAHDAVRMAIATLEKSPVDPDANLTVGKYACFVKGDWEHGLPLLALGNDPVLKSLGEQEVKGVASSDEQAHLGDAWWNAAEFAKGPEKKQLQARAAHWYQSALPSLSGLPRDKVASRLRKMQEELPVYLAKLPVTEVRVLGETLQVPKAQFKGKSSPYTLWAHPPQEQTSSHQAYQLDGDFRTLRGDAGVSGSEKVDSYSPLTFRIVGDGKTLWRSKPLQQRESSVSFRVNVSNIKKLELMVDCPGSNICAWALWIDPVLEH